MHTNPDHVPGEGNLSGAGSTKELPDQVRPVSFSPWLSPFRKDRDGLHSNPNPRAPTTNAPIDIIAAVLGRLSFHPGTPLGAQPTDGKIN